MLEQVGPKQSAISQLINLRLINAKFSTLGQMYLYDINTVQNANEIARPSTNPKIIGVDGKIQVKRGWIESGIVWIALVGRAGVGKTHTIKAITEPLAILS